jgi:hypothetical protein
MAVLLLVVGLVPLLRAASILHQGWHPLGDDAIIALRAQDVTRREAPLVGQPTTAESLKPGASPSNHPGPLEFYLLAGPVALLGTRVGTLIGAGLIVSLSLVATVWLARRRGGVVLAALVALGLLALARSIGGTSLHNPWNSEISLFPMVLSVFAVWSVLAGDLAVAWIAIVALSFVAQVHAGAAVVAAPLGVVVLVSLVVTRWRHRAPRPIGNDEAWDALGDAAIAVDDPMWAADRPAGRLEVRELPNIVIVDHLQAGPVRRSTSTPRLLDPADVAAEERRASISALAGFAIGLGFVLWLPVLLEELESGASNLRLLAQAGSVGVGRRYAFGWIATAMAPWPQFLRVGQGTQLGRPSFEVVVTGYVALGLTGTLAVVARLRRRESVHLLWAAVLALATGGLLAGTRSPTTVLLRPDVFRWMWILGLVLWIALLWSVWNLMPLGWQRHVRAPLAVACTVLVVAMGVWLVGTAKVRNEQDGRTTVAIGKLSRSIRSRLEPGTYRIRTSDGAAYWVVPGLMADLDAHGYHLLVDVGADFAKAYAPDRRFTGQKVDGTLLSTSLAGEYVGFPLGEINSGATKIHVLVVAR